MDGSRSFRSKNRKIFLAVSALATAALLIASREVLLPFILGMVVAYVCSPGVRRVERLKVPRWAAILIVYALALGAVGGFISTIVPRLASEARALATEWPKLRDNIRDDWLPKIDAKLHSWTGRGDSASGAPIDLPPEFVPVPEDDHPAPIQLKPRGDGSYDVHITSGLQISEVREGTYQLKAIERQPSLSSAAMLREGFDKALAYLRENTLTLLRIGQQIIGAVSYGIFTLFMTLMLGAYMMLTQERIFDFFRDLVHPASQPSYERFLARLDRGLSGVVRGQLLICFVNGVLSAIGFWLFGLKYWPILSVIAGAMSIIPIFGSILSSIPAVLIGLTQSFGTALGVLAWIVGIHQLEANFLNPKIIGDAAKIHPVLVVFSLLVGEHFFQIKGALFAVPCLSVLQTIFLHFRETTMGLQSDDAVQTVPPAPSLSLPELLPEETPKTDRSGDSGGEQA